MSHQVDLSNLPCPGDPGAPVPPDELENNPTQGSFISHIYSRSISMEFYCPGEMSPEKKCW